MEATEMGALRPEDRALDPALVNHATKLLEGIGMLDEAAPHTWRTPYRVIHYLKYLLPTEDGYDLTTFANEAPHVNEMVVVPNITFWAACSHHTLPFFGTVSVAYVPDELLIGLSKIPLMVRSIARGYWLQESLAHTIADELEDVLEPKGVAVHIRATHTCQLVKLQVPPVPEMVTTVLRGYFSPVHESGGISRAEFFSVIYGR